MLEQKTTLEKLGLPIPGTQMTVEAFHALLETTIRVEHIDGRVVYPDWNNMSPTPRFQHQLVVGNIYAFLRGISEGIAVIAPMDVRLAGDTVQPDVFWIAEGGACIPHDNYCEGPPDLCVEVLSPSNSKHDRVTKFELYQANGVSEYWIVDPDEAYIEPYTLVDGHYIRIPMQDNTFESIVLKQAVDTVGLFTP